MPLAVGYAVSSWPNVSKALVRIPSSSGLSSKCQTIDSFGPSSSVGGVVLLALVGTRAATCEPGSQRQAACTSSTGALVRRRTFEPSALIMYSSQLPPRLDTNVSSCPSADQVGQRSAPA